MDRLTTLPGEFHTEFPIVSVRLLVQTLGSVEHVVRSGVADIGVGSLLHMDLMGFRIIDVAGVKIIPVAVPGHPQEAQTNGAGPSQASDFVQLVLSEQPAGASRDIGVVSLNTWRINDQAARHKFLLAGLGWCGVPEPMLQRIPRACRLTPLSLQPA